MQLYPAGAIIECDKLPVPLKTLERSAGQGQINAIKGFECIMSTKGLFYPSLAQGQLPYKMVLFPFDRTRIATVGQKFRVALKIIHQLKHLLIGMAHHRGAINGGHALLP